MQSLKEIAIEYGVTPQAVLNWKVAAETRTGRSFTATPDPGDKRRVLYSPNDVAEITKGKRPKTAATEATEAAPITIVEGNHRHTLDAPMVPATVDLGQFRGGAEIAAYEDPLEMINGAMALIEGVNGAMAQDLANRVNLFKQTDLATQRLRQKAAQLEKESTRYAIESDLLGILQAQKTAELSELMGKVQALGGDGQG